MEERLRHLRWQRIARIKGSHPLAHRPDDASVGRHRSRRLAGKLSSAHSVSGVWNALAASLRVAILLMLVVAPRSAVVASEVTTPSGLRIIDDKPDTGPVPTFM
jgi:hypothetical protein